MKWLLWPVSVAGMTSIGRYAPYGVAVLATLVAGTTRVGRYLWCEVAVLARIGGRYEPYWPLFAA